MKCTFSKVLHLQLLFSTTIKRFILKQIVFCSKLYYLPLVQVFIAVKQIEPYYAILASFSNIFVFSSHHSNYK